MPVRIISFGIKPELSTSEVDYLQGPFLGKMVATIEFVAEWSAQAGLTADNEDMLFVAASKTITWNGGNFENEGFKAGDTFTITGDVTNNGNYTVASVSGNVLTTVEAIVDDTSETALLTGTTECTGVNFFYNLIENADGEVYNSLTDGNVLKFSKGGIDYTDTSDDPVPQQGAYSSNHLGSCLIKGENVLNTFTITHTFYITPFMLVDQLSDLLSGIAPEYLFDTSCFKYIYNIELLPNILNPNKKHVSSETFNEGNNGWFNETFNGGVPQYSVDDVVFTLDGVEVDNPDFEDETDFEITLTSDNGVFSNNNTKVVVNHFILPEAESQYKNTTTDQTENFMFDRALQTVGSAQVNGDNFGTDKQVLTNIIATYVSATEITITGKLNLSSAYAERIGDLTNKRFILSVTVQDHTKDTDESDAGTYYKEVNSYAKYLDGLDLATVDTNFNYFPSTTETAGEAGMFLEDINIGKSIIGFDIGDQVNDFNKIKNISVIIRAEKGAERFVMQQKDFSFAGAVEVSGVQQINVSQDRGFILGPTAQDFNTITLARRSDLDSGQVKAYELKYPFRIRWEDFIQLGGVNSEFYDMTQLFNGFNQDWNRYFIGSGWSLRYVVKVTYQHNDFTPFVDYEKEQNLYAYTYDDASDWTQTVKCFDIETDIEIPNDIIADKVCRLEVTFTKVSGSEPAIEDVFGIIEYEPYRQGGSNVIRNINSLYPHEDGSPFQSTLGNKLIEAEKTGSAYKFTTNIDGSKLTGFPKISGRIYDLTEPPFAGGKMFQSGVGFAFQSGVPYGFQ